MKSDLLYMTELLACIWEVSGFESWPQISYHEGFIFFPRPANQCQGSMLNYLY